jgi:hypothetical protein
MIKFTCTKCSEALKVPDSLKGSVFICPNCNFGNCVPDPDLNITPKSLPIGKILLIALIVIFVYYTTLVCIIIPYMHQSSKSKIKYEDVIKKVNESHPEYFLYLRRPQIESHLQSLNLKPSDINFDNLTEYLLLEISPTASLRIKWLPPDHQHIQKIMVSDKMRDHTTEVRDELLEFWKILTPDLPNHFMHIWEHNPDRVFFHTLYKPYKEPFRCGIAQNNKYFVEILDL